MDIREWALNLIEKNPNVSSNPMGKQMVEAIRSGDNAKGEQLANNLLNTYGISREDGIAQAKKFFGF